jgi:hypothetical protein
MPPLWGAIVVAVVLAAPAEAQTVEFLVVSDSAAIGYPRGSLIEDGAAVKVAVGSSLELIDSSGRGKIISGPFDGPVHAAPAAAAPPMLAAMKRIAALGDDRQALAVARGGTQSPYPTDPHAIDAGDEATQCASSDGPVLLWRPPPQHRSTLFLVRLSTGERATLDWPSNRASLPWPDTIKLADGETYQAGLQGELTKARFVVRVVPFDKPGPDAARRLADVGCARQALDMLEALVESPGG